MPVKWKKKPPTKQQLTRIVNEEKKACLLDTGRYIRAKAAKYPPQNPASTYRRTGTLGRSIAVGRPYVKGRRAYVEVGTNVPYAPYVEFGTGLYGPRKRVIRPVRARVLAWRVTGAAIGKWQGRALLVAMGVKRRKGRTVRHRPMDQYMVFARYVRGFPGWHFMQKAFEAPDSRRYFQTRAALMVKRIRARLAL